MSAIGSYFNAALVPNAQHEPFALHTAAETLVPVGDGCTLGTAVLSLSIQFSARVET